MSNEPKKDGVFEDVESNPVGCTKESSKGIDNWNDDDYGDMSLKHYDKHSDKEDNSNDKDGDYEQWLMDE